MESQLSKNHKGLIETKTKSREALIASKTTEETKRIQKSKSQNCHISRESGAGISKVCFRDSETLPHNNKTEDDKI